MVISTVMVNTEVKRILIHQGSSADILFRDAFNKLRLTNTGLCPYVEELIGFTGEKVWLDGYIPIHVTLGSMT